MLPLHEPQHALGVPQLGGHPLPPQLASHHWQGEAKTGLRPGAQLSRGSAGQPRISTPTVGCGPGGAPGGREQIEIIF